ncbi:MAG: hypothetical protein AAF810_07175 [Cyanobacteria bacterium P01_D01_bin.36]
MSYVCVVITVITVTTIFFEMYQPEVPQNVGEDTNSRFQEFSSILGAITSVLSTMLVMYERYKKTRKELREISEKRRIKAKYPGLSVVGVFLNRFDNSYVIAKNIISLTLCVYILLVVLTPVPMKLGIIYFLIAYLVILFMQSYAINYRVKKGYYLTNESETRELIDFIRSNSDDIDFTDKNMRIISKRDLEDAVLTEMRRVPAT